MNINYKLTKQDLDFIDSIIRVTKSIDTLYKKLYELDMQGLRESDEYKKHLEYLVIAQEVEEENYKKANLSADRSFAILRHLIEEKLPDNSTNNLDAIISGDDSNKVVRRIVTNLGTKLLVSKGFLEDIAPKGLVEFLDALGLPNAKTTVSDSMSANIQMANAFQNDILSTFLTFVEEAMKDKNNSSFLTELLKIKYDISFICNQVEEDMIRKGFSPSSPVIIGSKFTSEILGIENLIYKILKNKYGTELVGDQISEMLENDDLDYGNKNKAISMIIRQQLMRSGFLLMDDDIIMEVNSAYHDLVDDANYSKLHSQNNISQALIVQAFRRIKKDREKHGTMTIRPQY